MQHHRCYRKLHATVLTFLSPGLIECDPSDLKSQNQAVKVYLVSLVLVENRFRQWKVPLCFLKIQRFTPLYLKVWHYLSALKQPQSHGSGLFCFTTVFYKVRQILERYFNLFTFPIYILIRGALCKQRKLCMEGSYISWSLIMQVQSVVWLQSRHFNNAVRAQWLPCGCGEGKQKRSIMGCTMLSCDFRIDQSQRPMGCVHVYG